MKLIQIILAAAMLVGMAGAAEIRPDQINNSLPFQSIVMDENANITLDGGLIKNFQSDGGYNPLSYGAIPGDGADDSLAIQNTIDAATSEFLATGSRQIVIFPPGTYNINESRAHYGSPNVLLEPRPGVIFFGYGATIVAPANYRNATQGMCLFYNYNSSEHLDGFEVHGLTFNNNGGENPVASGTSNLTMIGAMNCSNVVFRDVTIKDTTGLWCLYFGQTDARVTTDQGLIIDNCKFINVSTGVGSSIDPDHTSIFSNIDRTIVSGCVFNSSENSVGTAIELHGNNSMAVGNIIENYQYGIHLATKLNDGVDDIRGLSAVGNVIDVYDSGIGIWAFTGESIDDVTITGNNIRIYNDVAWTDTIGIGTFTADGDIKNVSIKDNTVKVGGVSTVTTYCIYLVCADNPEVVNNDVIGSSRAGIYVIADNGLGTANIALNEVKRCGTTWPNDEGEKLITTGITFNSIKTADGGTVVIKDNTIDAEGAGYYGIIVNGKNVTRQYVFDNLVSNVQAFDLWDWGGSGYTDETLYIDHRAVQTLKTYLHYASDGSRVYNMTTGTTKTRSGGAWV